MAVDTLTEEQARQLATADAVIVHEYRSAFEYALWLVLSAGALAGLTYPFWGSYIVPDAKMPGGMALFIGFVMLLVSRALGAELKATRQPSSWALIITTNQLYVKFRSFRHWQWSKGDKTVLRLTPHDIDYIQPIEYSVRTGSGENRSMQLVRTLEIFLRDPLPVEVITAIKRENMHMPFKVKGRVRWRADHKPALVGQDGRVLAVNIGRTEPDFAKIVGALGSRYRAQRIAGMNVATRMDDTAPDLTLAVVREIERVAANGDKLEAIRMLRQYTNLTLSEAKQAVEKGVEATVGHLIRRAV